MGVSMLLKMVYRSGPSRMVGVMIAPVLSIALIAACSNSAPANSNRGDCRVTPDSTYKVNGYALLGKRGGDMFLFTQIKDQVFHPNEPYKMLVLLKNLKDRPKGDLLVRGKNLASGTTVDFKVSEAEGSYGRDWGTNYVFPESGCWKLSVDETSNAGDVVIEVK